MAVALPRTRPKAVHKPTTVPRNPVSKLPRSNHKNKRQLTRTITNKAPIKLTTALLAARIPIQPARQVAVAPVVKAPLPVIVAPAIQLVAEPQPAPLLNKVFDNRQQLAVIFVALKRPLTLTIQIPIRPWRRLKPPI
jgi:hypothetical protein